MFIARIKATIATLFVILIGMVTLYFSFQSIDEYFKYTNVIVYSWLGCFAFIFSFVMILLSYFPGYVILHGVKIPPEKSKKVYRCITVIFIISFVFPALFSVFYINKIEAKGYVRCKGVPKGWMPAMATKYAINTKFCSNENI